MRSKVRSVHTHTHTHTHTHRVKLGLAEKPITETREDVLIVDV